MLIAVASRDGLNVDQHFGHAERFLIYEVSVTEAKLVGEKKVERYCSLDQDHPLRGHLLKAISESLTGCRAVVCAQIGQAPQMEMERLGLDVFVTDGAIQPTLVELAKML
jgi:predicted Fe-Mo cluster-binding NifX family protein